MTPDSDPYRTLGLTRDATLDEVRRAYRRLAKANHPDAAGEAALPRFLAIQAAYDTIAGPDAGIRRPGPARPSGPRRPWDPDRDRTEATYRAYGGRPRRARPTGGAGPGPARGRSGPRPSAEAPGTSRPPRPERPPNKATLGSTSYDGAEAEPFEPDWGGASWYGTTSGTYWTLNPKEYADPRKHGPEYQARARRQLGGWEDADEQDPAADPATRPGTASPGMEPGPAAAMGDPSTRPADPGPRGARPAMHTTSSWWEATAGHEPRPDDTAPSRRPRPDRAGRAGRAGSPASAPRAGSPASAPRAGERARSPGEALGRHGPATSGPAGTDAHTVATAGPATDVSPRGDRGRDLTTEAVLAAVRAWLDDDRPGAIGRIARAFVGWAPMALGVGWVGGEVSGCGRFAAGCDDGVVMGTWLAQIAVLVALLVAGRLARISSVATLATLAAGIPAALLLSATGNPDDTAAGRVALSGLLVIAWVVGLVFGATRELRGTGVRGPGPPAAAGPGAAGPGRPVS